MQGGLASLATIPRANPPTPAQVGERARILFEPKIVKILSDDN